MGLHGMGWGNGVRSQERGGHYFIFRSFAKKWSIGTHFLDFYYGIDVVY